MTVNLLQQLNSIPNPGGTGVPVTQYAQELQNVLTAQLTKVPNQELSTLQSTQTALTSLQTALSQLQSATETLTSSQQWNPVTVSSSNPTALSVTSTPGAQPASYSISIGTLAQNQVNFSTSGWQSSASGTSSLTAGTIMIAPVSGTTVSIAVTSGESLNAIAAAVDASTTLVSASVINNGNSTNPYELVFQSTETGTIGAFSLTDGSGSNLVSTQLAVGTATQAALNATVTLDGSVALQSYTNTFTNAIPNVTFTAQQANTSGTININQDSSTVLKNVQTWMDSYNSVVDLLKQDTSYTPAGSNGTPAQSGPLFSDPNSAGLLSQLPGAINSIVSTSQSTINSLASVGIVLDPNTGHVEFQPSAGFTGGSPLPDGKTLFTNALQQNPTAVQQLFGVVQNVNASSVIPTTGVLGNMYNTLQTFGTIAGLGTIGTDLTAITGQQKNVNSYLTQINQQITQQVANFTTQLNQLNAALQQSSAQSKLLASLIGGSSSSASSSPIP